jgi:hypothetical protein
MLRIVVAGLVVLGAMSIGVANAGTPFDTTVTIHVEGRDFSGTVNSSRPMRCANNRKVILFKQLGAQQDPQNDTRVASDTTSFNGGHYQWNTGNTGIRGKFYARAPKTSNCKADSSLTVHTTN